MGLQVFLINPDGTTTELHTDGPIKDILKTDQCYVVVSDDIRKVFLWKGLKSSVRSKFIGAKRSQQVRGTVGMHYSSESLDEADETDDFLKVIGGKTEAGIAQEIKDEKTARPKPGGHPMRQKAAFAAPKPAEGMNIAGSRQRQQQSQNTGPLYTGQDTTQYYQEDQQANFDQIMQKLEEIKIPEGYERELIIIGNHAYAVVEKVQTFLGKRKVEKVIEQVGSIPEGIFFAEGYSPRVLSENGKIIAIEFLKNYKEEEGVKDYKEKKLILKEQIRAQLGDLNT